MQALGLVRIFKNTKFTVSETEGSTPSDSQKTKVNLSSFFHKIKPVCMMKIIVYDVYLLNY